MNKRVNNYVCKIQHASIEALEKHENDLIAIVREGKLYPLTKREDNQ